MKRADLRVAALITAILLGVGLPAGILWWWVAPQPTYRVAADGLYFLGAQPQAYIAADGWFAVISSVIGLTAGVVVWLRCRRTGLGAVVGLFLGGLGGAATAAVVGVLLGRSDPFAAPIGAHTQGPLELRAWGVLLVEAGVALVVWLLLDLLVLRDEDTPPAVPEGSGVPDLVGSDLEGPDPAMPEDRPDYGAVRDL